MPMHRGQRSVPGTGGGPRPCGPPCGLSSQPQPNCPPGWRCSPRRVSILSWYRVTEKWALRGLAGPEVGAASTATGGWAAARTRRSAVASEGILSFTDGCSMISTAMTPLFAGLGLGSYAPGGVAAPPGVTSLSLSCVGLRGVCRRAPQDGQGRLRARGCLRDTLASLEDIAPFQARPYPRWMVHLTP